MLAKMNTGTYTGTGSSLAIEVGFIPTFLILWNETDGDVVALWGDGVASGASIDIGAAAATNAAGSIIRNAGTIATTAQGFLTGTDHSESAKVFRWIAFGF